MAALSDAIDRHQQWLQQSERRAALVDGRARYRLRRLIVRHRARCDV